MWTSTLLIYEYSESLCIYSGLQCWQIKANSPYVIQTYQLTKFLGALAKLRKAIISFFLCLPDVRPHGITRFQYGDFHEILYTCIFRKFVEKIQVSLKSDTNNGYVTWKPKYIFENSNTNFMFNNFFLNLAVYDLMLKHMYSQRGHRWQQSTAG